VDPGLGVEPHSLGTSSQPVTGLRENFKIDDDLGT
jgi:hypothetical protein